MTAENEARARELAQALGFEPHVFSDEKTVVLKDVAYAKACRDLARALDAEYERGRAAGLRRAKEIVSSRAGIVIGNGYAISAAIDAEIAALSADTPANRGEG